MAMDTTTESPVSTASAEVIALPVERRPGPPKGVKMPKWTPERRAKFQRTMRRKAKERERAARQETRKGRKGRRGASTIARPRAAYAARQAARGGSEGAIGPRTGPQDGRKARAAGEERLDAIAYLRAAVEGYEAIPTSVCLSLLALRRLLGQIK